MPSEDTLSETTTCEFETPHISKTDDDITWRLAESFFKKVDAILVLDDGFTVSGNPGLPLILGCRHTQRCKT